MDEVRDRWLSLHRDVSGGLAEAQISNIAFTAINAIAHLRDHLRSWAKHNDHPMEDVDELVRHCSAI